jgi:prephenate dehydrogenase
VSPASTSRLPRTIGIIGLGAFGRLMAHHLSPHFALRAYDPELSRVSDQAAGLELGTLETAASCDIVILANPVDCLGEVVAAIRPHLRAGTLVLDVGSVKVAPARIMAEGLPDDVDIIATHPLFGPQSARNGIRGLRIALCPIRGSRLGRTAAFLRRVLGLEVIITTPEAHDRETAAVQGLTHLIAKVLVQMEPLPSRLTTKSFDLLMEAVGMVRHDAPEVFNAIERTNPYALDIRQRFFALAAELEVQLSDAGAEAIAA